MTACFSFHARDLEPMARIARLVVPGVPHPVTRRGNRRERTFFETRLTVSTAISSPLPRQSRRGDLGLLPDAQPRPYRRDAQDEDGLRRTFGDLHRRYTAHFNARHHWTGHLWQARFGSVAMDEDHL